MAETVRDVMEPVIVLEATRVATGQAWTPPGEKSAFVLLQDPDGGLRGPLLEEEVRQALAEKGPAGLQELLSQAPSPIFVPPETRLESVARTVAKDLVLEPRLAGVVVRERGQEVGVVPRKVLAQMASRLVTRGTADRLEGAPVDLPYFFCPEDGERQIVFYYDPQNPPRCARGHLMQPLEE